MNYRSNGPAQGIAHPPFTVPPRRLYGVVAILIAAGCVATVMLSASGRGVAVPSTFDSTRGPHIEVSALPGVSLATVTRLPGLSAASGPFPGVDTSIRHGGEAVGIHLEGRAGQFSAVDRPQLVAGRWAGSNGIVLERDFAARTHLEPGDRVEVVTTRGRMRLTVAGIATTTVPRRHSLSPGGLGYVPLAVLRRAAPAGTYSSTVMLRLSDPGKTGEFGRWIESRYPGMQVTVDVAR